MQSVQVQQTFSLAAVKPLEQLKGYREFCLAQTRAAVAAAPVRRTSSPITGRALEPYATVGGLPYLRCPDTGSLFLAEVAEPEAWDALLAAVQRHRHSPATFHRELAQSRVDNVYAPKLEWIQSTLQLQERDRPRALELATPPSGFTALLQESTLFSAVTSLTEAACLQGQAPATEVAILLETLDHVAEPAALVRQVARCLPKGGLLFLTALVASGFDMTLLGPRNLYLYPPDRANCFTLAGLVTLLEQAGFELEEVSTPGVLDVEIVQAHRQQEPQLPLSEFERRVLDAGMETAEAFQTFLQQRGLSSFGRIVARRA